ncbi:hypothetical protein VNO78_21297 [Psophocarpus tetragonolobus]|uniref:Uncharacterized protein n=1 Tax=Psophocarpus tetragonolobus TaxID=3891 RepID=A0AAN9SGB0_PSOTE
MEGWLYVIATNRLGLHCSGKRYFILKECFLRSFKHKPLSQIKEPNRSAIIDSSVQIIDNGRDKISKKVFFIFTVYNASNKRDQLKDAALKENSNLDMNFVTSFKKKHSSLRGLLLISFCFPKQNYGLQQQNLMQ